DYDYQLPDSADTDFTFTATVAVQPKIEVADWTALEVPAADAEVPQEAVDEQIELLRNTVAELAPADGRPAREGDTVVVDLVNPSAEAQRDYVIEIGAGRVLEEIEDALVGMTVGDTREVTYEGADGAEGRVAVTLKDVKEKVLPAVDDELARAASEFDTLEELRNDIEAKIRHQLELEVESQFRAAAADALVVASDVRPSSSLVAARTQELLYGLVRSLESRGISPETYLAVTNQTTEQLHQRLGAEAALSVARELVLESVAEKLGLEVSDDELREFIRENAAEAEDGDPEEVVARVFESGRHEQLREDLLMRKALDRVAAEVKRVPLELARAREKLWTPEKEKGPRDTKLWTPASKERA